MVITVECAQSAKLVRGATVELKTIALLLQVLLQEATSSQTVHALLATLAAMVFSALLAFQALTKFLVVLHLASIATQILILLHMLLFCNLPV